MPQSNKKIETKGLVDPEIKFYIKLVNKVRRSKDEAVINDAFLKIANGLSGKIKKIVGRYRIPGCNFDDVYQEALYALRYKAIKDYDQTRGSGEGPAAFDRFALLCIRRHLATTVKTSQQNRHTIINNYKSLDQDRGFDNDELSLVNILPKTEGDICGEITDREYFKIMVNKLLAKLSHFEKQVFYLYVRQYTYEEIADEINRIEQNTGKNKIPAKAIDNALSRLKQKSKHIYQNQQEKEGF